MRLAAALVAGGTLVAVGGIACGDLRAADATSPDGAASSSSSGSASSSSSTSSSSSSGARGAIDASDVDCPTGVCVLAANRLSPADLTVRAGYVYWVEQGTAANNGKDGRLSRAPEHTCEEDAGCVLDLYDAGANVSGLAVDATDVFLTFTSLGANGRVLSLPISGGPTTLLASTETGARRIAVTDARVLWVNGASPGQIRGRFLEEPAGTPGGTTLADDLDFPAALAVSRDKIFFSVRGQTDTDGSIRRIDIDGANPITIAASQPQPRGVAVDSTFVFWVDRGNGTVHRARWDGTSPAELVTSARSPFAIAVDADGIYWAESGTDPDFLDGRVRRADLDGKHVTTLAEIPAPVAVAVSGSYVYAASRGTGEKGYRDGSIIKMHKP